MRKKILQVWLGAADTNKKTPDRGFKILCCLFVFFSFDQIDYGIHRLIERFFK
jgi:hypothetical protein